MINLTVEKCTCVSYQLRRSIFWIGMKERLSSCLKSHTRYVHLIFQFSLQKSNKEYNSFNSFCRRKLRRPLWEGAMILLGFLDLSMGTSKSARKSFQNVKFQVLLKLSEITCSQLSRCWFCKILLFNIFC